MYFVDTFVPNVKKNVLFHVMIKSLCFYQILNVTTKNVVIYDVNFMTFEKNVTMLHNS